VFSGAFWGGFCLSPAPARGGNPSFGSPGCQDGQAQIGAFFQFLAGIGRFLRDFDGRFGALVIQAMFIPFFRRFFRAVGMDFARPSPQRPAPSEVEGTQRAQRTAQTGGKATANEQKCSAGPWPRARCKPGRPGRRPETLTGQGNALVCVAERGRLSPEGARQGCGYCAPSGLGMKTYCDVIAFADPGRWPGLCSFRPLA